MALSDFQMTFNGLTFGLGTAVGIESISGFEDWEASLGDTPVPRAWGDVPGLHTVNSKEVMIELNPKTDEALNDVLLAFQPTESDEPGQLFLKDPHTTEEHYLWARSIGRIIPKNPATKFKRMVSVRLKAADPRLYSLSNIAAAAGLYDPSGGGFDYAVAEYGKEYAGAQNNGEVTLTNLGNSKAYPVIKVFGPASGTHLTTTITNTTTGQVISFDHDTGLLSSDVFVADMRRIVTADPGDQPYVYLEPATNSYGDWDLPREPFYLQPGDNVIRLEITGTATEAQASFSFRHTSI